MWALTIKQKDDEYTFYNSIELRSDSHERLLMIADNIMQVDDEIQFCLKKSDPPATGLA